MQRIRSLLLLPLEVLLKACEVDCLRWALQSQATVNELLGIDHVGIIRIEEREKHEGVRWCDIEQREEALSFFVIDVFLESFCGNRSRAVGIQVFEHGLKLRLDVIDVHLLVVGNLSDHEVSILLRALDGTLAEKSGNNIQHGEDGDRNEEDEQKHVDQTDLHQGLRNKPPIQPTGNRREKREHRARQRAPILNERSLVCLAIVITWARQAQQFWSSNLCEQYGEEVYIHPEQNHRPDQRLQGQHDRSHEYAKIFDEVHDSCDTEQPNQSGDTNNT
mmetsp:Transcript_64059/g.209026  ORF Transcript_64059/g.209026 Transcript_64059/m.209026 type:complete len:276 (-) Transcript_64059:812-1639(-)